MHVSLFPKPKVAHSIKINASECTPKPKRDRRRRRRRACGEGGGGAHLGNAFCALKALKVKWEKRKRNSADWHSDSEPT